MHCCFIPPYLLRRLAASGDEGGAPFQRTLAVDSKLRARRESAAPSSQYDTTTTAVRDVAAAGDLRVIHDAHSTETLPGDVVRRDSDPPTQDPAVDEAFDSSGEVLQMFADQFGRRSVDGNGATLSVTVHYGTDYDNAFWDGQQLVFGDGDGRIFERFTKPMDVMAHEFTHGVTQYSAGLTYQGQSGALNESVSDAFASMTKQWVLNQNAADADWLIGEGLFLPSINGRALRSMADPGTAYDDPQLGRDPQVGVMSDYVDTTDDNGGVHINSGIPNHAFALAAVAVGGYSWEKTGKVWYDALTGGEVTAGTDFAGFAQATVASAGRLFPDDATVSQHITDAWAAVGVLPSADSPAVDRGYSAAAHPASPANAQRVAVTRTGGFAGTVRRGEVDLSSDPRGPEIRGLLMAVNLSELATGSQGADRFAYTVEFGQVRLNVSEPNLTPELHRVVRIVLGDQSTPTSRTDE